MLSKVVSSFILRNPASKNMVAPLMFARSNTLYSAPQRYFIDKLGIDHSAEIATPEQLKAGEVSLWKDVARQQETALALKDRDQIEKYVLSLCRNYFRTTKKAKLSLESSF